jgi:3-oxocholest-4-en-26-oyl-CoA dehydrogenase beta subunit
MMDFTLSETQKMLRTVARDFLKLNCPGKLVREIAKDEKGFPPRLWQEMSKMGWMGLIIPEEYGGAGGSLTDLAILLEEMGRVCLPGPFFSSVVLGGLTLLESGNEEQKKRLLPRLAQGELILTLAMTEENTNYVPDSMGCTASPIEGGFIIRGKKLFVPDARVADYLVCTAVTALPGNSDSITLFLVDTLSPGIIFNPLKTMAGDMQYEVIFQGVKVPADNVLGEIGQGWPILRKILEKATVAQCAEMAGGARQILEMTLEYAKQRKAFGRAIGSFQIIKHYFSDMLVSTDGSSLMVYNTAWRLDEKLPSSRNVSMTKVLMNECFHDVTKHCTQILGAIGFSEDYDAQLYFKRAKTRENCLGSTMYHLDRISRFRQTD